MGKFSKTGSSSSYRKRDGKDKGDYVRKDHRERESSKNDREEKEHRPYSRDKNKNTEKEEGKKGYKQKRSFTRNKELRKGVGFKKDSSRSFGHKTDSGHQRPFKRNDKYGAKKDGKSFAGRENKSSRFTEKSDRFEKRDGFAKKTPYKKFEGADEGYSRKPFKRRSGEEDQKPQRRVKHEEFEAGKSFSEEYKKPYSKEKKSAAKNKPQNSDGLTRLNKYLANAGIASRREADVLIKSGVVKVNGVPVTEMGFKVKPGDTVTYGDAPVKSERKIYLLLNKPKDYITTMDDPQERKTVMDLVAGACKERVYPVGRLDRNTTGLLLLTNDGELTKKLTHPKHEIKKVYHVTLNKGIKPDDFRAITEGVELEDGMINADDLAFVGEGKKEIGIEIHSGRNRIVRRLFEHLGYEVLKLDRVMFAGLTKKDLPRGKHRFLTQKEVNFLQMIG